MTEASKPPESADADLGHAFLKSGSWFVIGYRRTACSNAGQDSQSCLVTIMCDRRPRSYFTNIIIAHRLGTAFTLARALIFTMSGGNTHGRTRGLKGFTAPSSHARDTPLICAWSGLARFRISYACSLCKSFETMHEKSCFN
jgi:hypothetical protein